MNVYHNHSKEFFNNIDQNKNRYKDLFLDAEKYLDSILDEIKKQKIDNESLILIMSDHGVSQGEKFGEHAYGAFCYDYTLRTFAYFLVKDLPSIEIRTIDFMPTILDYLDLEHDKNYNKIGGRSLIPLFNGSSMEEEIAFSETGNPLYEKKPPKEPNTRSVRTSKWKYIKNIYDESEELYDIINDPNEEKNIIDIDSKVSNELRYKMNEILNS